jgi:hypothetical protein
MKRESIALVASSFLIALPRQRLLIKHAVNTTRSISQIFTLLHFTRSYSLSTSKHPEVIYRPDLVTPSTPKLIIFHQAALKPLRESLQKTLFAIKTQSPRSHLPSCARDKIQSIPFSTSNPHRIPQNRSELYQQYAVNPEP